jgi:FKBP-type peptidyl-prolyl cis-trans isomerase
VKSRHCAAAVVGGLLMAATLSVHAQTSGNTTPSKTVPVAKLASEPTPAETKSKASYSLGVSVGTQLHSLGLTPNAVTSERILQGLKDALAGKATAGAEDQQRVQALIEQAHNALGATNKTAAANFLADNGKLPGVVTTASGLQYKVVRPGSGDAPKATDQATVNYRGTLLDGTEFDSSYKRNQPATFQVGQVIKGWQEALQLMKPGSKYELYIPPELAYGANSPPPIPPNSLLKFEVELLSVKPAPAPALAPLSSAPKKN